MSKYQLITPILYENRSDQRRVKSKIEKIDN